MEQSEGGDFPPKTSQSEQQPPPAPTDFPAKKLATQLDFTASSVVPALPEHPTQSQPLGALLRPSHPQLPPPQAHALMQSQPSKPQPQPSIMLMAMQQPPVPLSAHPAKGLYYGMVVGVILQTVAVFLVICFANWKKEATSAEERLRIWGGEPQVEINGDEEK